MQKIILNEERGVTLTAFLQQNSREVPFVSERPAVLVLPGGGYRFCSDREADPVAYAYLAAGYHAFVLRYSVNAAWPQPLCDYEEAMEYILAHAKEWHILPDKIAAVGFSAGGHLAAMAASTAEHRPAAAILGYPALKESFWRSQGKPDIPDAVSSVNERTSPCFLFATRTDELVPVDNTLDFAAALTRCHVEYELHIYPYGPHGLSTASPSLQLQDGSFSPRFSEWVASSVAWLKDVLGEFSSGGMTRPKVPARTNGDLDETFSIRCTLACLHANEEAEKAVEPLFARARAALARTGEENTLFTRFGEMTLKDFAALLRASKEELTEIDEKLRSIKNPRA